MEKQFKVVLKKKMKEIVIVEIPMNREIIP